MRYEHHLRFGLSAEEAAAAGPGDAEPRVNSGLLNRRFADITEAAWSTPERTAIDVRVILPTWNHPDEQVTRLLRIALRLLGAADPPVALRLPVPVPDPDDPDPSGAGYYGGGLGRGAGSGPLSAPGAPPASPPQPPPAGGAPAPPSPQPTPQPESPWPRYLPEGGGDPFEGGEGDDRSLAVPPLGGGGTPPGGAGRDWVIQEERSAPRRAPAPPATRYLRGEYPGQVRLWKPFSLVVRVTQAGGENPLKPFSVPPQGQDILLVAHSPGLRVLGDHRQVLRVPASGDSEPVRFDLRAEVAGPGLVSVTAWLGGTYLGELAAEVTAGRDGAEGPAREASGEVAAGPAEGAVSLVVRRDRDSGGYRFEFRDVDMPDEVVSQLSGEPGQRVEALISDLTALARGRAGFTPAQTRRYLMNEGAKLWQELIPGGIRDQFWERQHRIRQLTILTKDDVVPWELLYPKDPGRDEGFLVEQFPVTRLMFGQVPARRLALAPAWFVLPEGSPPEAGVEVESLRRLLRLPPPGNVISGLDPLDALLGTGDFGLLHFACHNTFDPVSGSSIRFGPARFEPSYMTLATIERTLARSGPLVFINACRAAGLAPSYNRLDGWASTFMAAGAGAFIGSLWAVADETAREFALAVYGRLAGGEPLGEAVRAARLATSGKPGDPTWLAYSAYGNPRAVAGGTGAAAMTGTGQA